MQRFTLPGLLLIAAAACGTSAESNGTSTASAASTGDAATTGGDGGTGGQSPACVKQAADLQAVLEKSKPATAPGAILAVKTPACGVWVGVTGTSTKTEPVAADDVFRIGSTTKTFISARVLQLVEAGTVTLDDTLEHWLPGFPNGAAISVRQLMNHSSGIFSYTESTDFSTAVNANPKKKWTHQALVDLAAAEPPYFAPGAGFQYSNTNYILLGMLVEKAASDTIGKEVRQQELTPNHLATVSFDGEEPIIGHLAHGFQGSTDITTAIDPSVAWAAGAIVANPGDLVNWADELYSGMVLKDSTQKELLTTIETGQAGVTYGLGVFVLDKTVAPDTMMGHGGDTFGYHTTMWHLPNQQITLSAVVNADGADPEEITNGVLLYFFP